MDNQAPEVDNAGPVSETPATQTAPNEVGFSWKTQIGSDLANAPTFQKFEDSPDGLKKAFESHANLEKLLGHEKVPIPKDANDVEGWSRFSKALGIPDKAEGYGLADAQIPEAMKELTFDKNKFAETVHAFKLTPNQAKGLWEAYTKMTIDNYSQYLKNHETNMVNVVNKLKSEWGDTYDSNVQLGQMVISKFAGDKDTEDFLSTTLSKDPRAIKFLAKIGNHFAENKVGEFNYQRFSKAPEEAMKEIEAITNDPKHPYLNDKARPAEREAAINYVNSLYAIVNKSRQG